MRVARQIAIMTALCLAGGPPAWALPELSATFGAGGKGSFGPAPCAKCHVSAIRFQKNLYVDVRLPNGVSLMNKEKEVVIPWQAGETVTVVIVVGLEKQDLSAKFAGWFMRIPESAILAPGIMQYGYRRINYERPGEFTADGVEYRTWGEMKLTLGRRMAPVETELWVGVGESATGKFPGSSQRMRTLGLLRTPVRWAAAEE